MANRNIGKQPEELEYEREKETLSFEAGKVFTPTVPISEAALFAGRLDQIRRIVDAVNQRGQHAVIFGERGVGKTSLANIISSKLQSPSGRVLSPKINCDGTDSFTKLWRKIFLQVDVLHKKPAPGFKGKSSFFDSERIPEEITPDDIRRLLTVLSHDEPIIICIFDEFDRLTNLDARRSMADTIKSLSDNDVSATIVVVGVADTVDDLIAEHQSIERALVQVQMPRMSTKELHEILDRGVERLRMGITDDAKAHIARLSQGFPHYTHLLALHATRMAIDSDESEVSSNYVGWAMTKAVEDTQQSLKSDYHKAVTSPQKDNIYRQVLLACALTRADEFGYFAAADVRRPLTILRNKSCDIPSFARHLNSFTQPQRGPVLRKIGAAHKFRYRFIDPLMQPLIVMKALSEGKITMQLINSISQD